MEREKQIFEIVDSVLEKTLIDERWLWEHPETGYKEWESNNYAKQIFLSLGYKIVEAGNIPGFYADVDTGKDGPTVCLMGELDALAYPNHKYAINGNAHACGHNTQSATVLGLAYALKKPHALDGLCGKIRLMLVPAEEMIELEYRDKLIADGVIKYYGGKPEFMSRGFFDGVDISFNTHATTDSSKEQKLYYEMVDGCNGIIAKKGYYHGKSAHAGGSPYKGVNAEYALMLGLNACNAVRETFKDSDHVRFHPITDGVKSAVNIIPNEVRFESYVRAKTMQSAVKENYKLNRALAGGALSLGAGLDIEDRAGYYPCVHDKNLMNICYDLVKDNFGEDRIEYEKGSWSTGSTDFGDLTAVMPAFHMYVAGAGGSGAHSQDYYIKDPKMLCRNAVLINYLLADKLLRDGGKVAKEVIKDYKSDFKSIKEYLSYLDKITNSFTAVSYDADGEPIVKLK